MAHHQPRSTTRMDQKPLKGTAMGGNIRLTGWKCVTIP